MVLYTQQTCSLQANSLLINRQYIQSLITYIILVESIMNFKINKILGAFWALF